MAPYGIEQNENCFQVTLIIGNLWHSLSVKWSFMYVYVLCSLGCYNMCFCVYIVLMEVCAVNIVVSFVVPVTSRH